MIIGRNRLWTIAVRLPIPCDALVSQSIRINPVIANKWHSIAATHLRKSNNPWPRLATDQINGSFNRYLPTLRNVHLHKRDVKYDEKNSEKVTKSTKEVSDEKENEQNAKIEPKISEEIDVTETSTTANQGPDNIIATDADQKLGIIARFKLLWKQYWYVLLPVHAVTSCFWFGGLYYLSTSGVDLPALLESLSVSESIIAKLRDSSLGHLAIAYMCYKILSPVRYTVTVGGTTLSIKYLSQWGYIRPVPSKEKLKQMYQDQKAKFKQRD